MYNIEYDFTDIHQNVLKSTLHTNNTEAVYRILDDRENGVVGNEETAYVVVNDSINKVFYANQETAYYRFPVHRKDIVYLDEYKNKLKWTINIENKKKIGKYNCTEAKTWFNGRNYTVWFTFDVPIKFGPLKLHQLPGLVVQVLEDTGLFKINIKSITKSSSNKEFNHYKKYFLKQEKIMNYKEFEKTVLELEVGFQTKHFADIKKENMESGTTTSCDNKGLDEEVVEFYLEFPANLKSALSKVSL